MGLSLILNGEVRDFGSLEAGSGTVGDLVEALQLKSDRVAIERNGEIVRRERWGATVLAAGDRLELVHFVGGGAGERGARPVSSRSRASQRVP